MSSVTLTGLKTHFNTIASEISDLTYEFGYAEDVAAKADKNRPLLLHSPGDPSSTWSSSELRAGIAYETHKCIFTLAIEYTLAQQSSITVTERYDTATAMLKEFFNRAFANAYIATYMPVQGKDNIPIRRRPHHSSDNEIAVMAEIDVRVPIGCSEYTTSTSCAAASLYYEDTTLFTTVASGGQRTVLNADMRNTEGTLLASQKPEVDFTAPDATIKNTANTTILSAPSGKISTLPNINLTDYKGDVASVVSGIDLTSTQLARTYQYPQPTGVVQSFRTGDDFDIQQAYFKTLSRGWVVQMNSDVDITGGAFLLLKENNIFGNLNRFTGINGNQNFTDNYAIDHFTGLGWYILPFTTRTWNNAIDDAMAFDLTVNGTLYSDFFLPNFNQFYSILRRSLVGSSSALLYSPFNYALSANFWVSTTAPNNSSNSYRVNTAAVGAEARAKTEFNLLFVCRKHF